MPNEELMQEFEAAFETIKKELGFKATLDELDTIFFLRDAIHDAGFVSTKLSRQICARMVQTFTSWAQYLHDICVPNPNSLFSMTENKMLADEDKKGLYKLMDFILEFASRNSLIGLTKDKKMEAALIDESLTFWNENLQPTLSEVVKKINKGWKEQVAKA